MTADKLSIHSVRPVPDIEEMLVYYRKQLREEAYVYLERRGLSEETVEQFRIGYASGKIGFYVQDNPLGDYFDNRIIIPIIDADGTPVDLLGRCLDDHREPKYKSLYGMDEVLFNEAALADAEDVVLCNGVFDVLTLAQARIPAVCVPGYLPFKEKHARKLKEKRVFICLGNDEIGRRESGRIESLLQEQAKETYIVHLPEAVKDVNDLFLRAQNPLDVFVQIINRTMEESLLIPVAPDNKNATVYMEEYMKRHRGQVSSIRTGLSKLDEALFGGLGSGLYVLAGPGSSGKSMLMKQMADHIAEQNIPVVYVSWDMTSFELWARSIARLLSVEPQQVLAGKVAPERIAEANKTYAGYNRMLWTVECSLETTFDRVASSVERVAAIAGREPVLFIDHLQRIPLSSAEPGGNPATVAQHQAAVAYKLKQWSRERNTPVVAAVPLDGGQRAPGEAIEASADVVMLLRPLQPAADGHPVELELAKNRNGPLSRIDLTFYNHQAVFRDDTIT
ncbi:DnaB-like helicase C-terminal domain-containing protein [Paenibacillus chartarius]|uniref:DnaB-like helicase C-terminal domain-containing protein n=1 Tax=Paenibacillus chartarius TaxID=747481 RepID=A0ABV6DQG3_9BACL